MQKVTAQSAKAMKPIDVVGAVNAGIAIVDAAAPVIKTLFEKIRELLESLGKSPNSIRGRRLRIEALEAQNKLQRELNKTYEARLQQLEQKLDNQ